MTARARAALPSRPAGAPSGRALVVAFSAVAVLFVFSTAVAEWSDVEIRRASAQITGNSAPSIQFLSAMRGELRRFTLLADDEVDRGQEHGGDGTTHTTPALAAARLEMDRAWASYRLLPTFPGERELWTAAEEAKGNIDGLTARLDAEMVRDDWAAARATLEQMIKPSADRLDTALMHIIELDARAGSNLARQIDHLGRRSILLAIILDGASVMLTVLAAVLIWRAVNRYTSVIERRADELELFAGRVAHDVLGPLGAAALALEIAGREAPPGGRTARMIASGKAGLQRARSIADGLLEFARAGARPGDGGRADVLEVVRAVVEEVEPAARARGIALVVEAVQPGEVACSPGILVSVVSNLVRNAVKYVGDGPRRRITIRARPIGARVRIEVEDNGRGLPPELGHQVFEPYVRGPGSTEPGIGLGLATVKKITEAHGGRVDVRSVPGLGCRFGIELPAPPPAPRTGGRGGRKDKEAVDRPAQAP